MKVTTEKTFDGKYIRASITNDGSMGIIWVSVPRTADQFSEVISELTFIRKELWPSYGGSTTQITIEASKIAESRYKGKVKWFNDAKGIGFITFVTAEHGPRDVFVHFTSIQKEGFRSLVEGEQVSFVIRNGVHGHSAYDVRPE